MGQIKKIKTLYYIKWCIITNLQDNVPFYFLFDVYYATDSCFVYVLKMEYVPEINIFGLKMMVKSGLEKIFLKSLHAQSLFRKIFCTL
jgi:hypothetical protein